MNRYRKQSGMTLVLAITLLSVLVICVSALTMHLLSSLREAQRDLVAEQTFQIAEAGLNHAMARLTENANYVGEKGVKFANGSFDVEVSTLSGEKVIRATGHWRGSSREFLQILTARSLNREKTIHILDWKQSRLSTTALLPKR